MLGQPWIPAGWIVENVTLPMVESDIKKAVAAFPEALDRAIADWAKFKAARAYFSDNESSQILDWFSKFPDLWEGLRPNYLPHTGEVYAAHNDALVRKADGFVAKLKAANVTSGMGVAWLLIAGIVVLATFGAAGLVWAVGYLKEQNNISTMIDQVAAGSLPPDVLNQAVQAEQSSVLGDLSGLVKWIAIGVIGSILLPPIVNAVRRVTT